MSVSAHPMPVAEALANGAPRNLGALAATATARGWGAMVERDGEVWTLVIAGPSDSRTGRCTWVGGKWGKNTHGYRETVAFYRSATDGAPGASMVAAVKVPAGDIEARTVAEAEAGSSAARNPLDAVKAGQKSMDALGDARKHKATAESSQGVAERAAETAEHVLTRAEAEKAAAKAEEAAERAAESVKECKKALQRTQRARTECRKAAENASGALYEAEADRAYESATDNVVTAREALGDAEEAAEAAKDAAECAQVSADFECLTCDEWRCACREIMCAMLARYGSGVARTVDTDAVRIGELIMSDDEDLYAAGQMMLCEAWDEAEELVTRAVEGPTDVVWRRAEPADVVTCVVVAEAPSTVRVRPSRRAGWENGRTRERAAVLEGWATVAEAEDYVSRFPECVEVYERFERYEGEWRRSALLSTVHAAGVEFGARLDFDGTGWTVSLPTGDVAGSWGDVARAVRSYVIAKHPANVVAYGEIHDRNARIMARREVEYLAAEVAGLRALAVVRTDASRAAAALRALRTVDVFMPDDVQEAVEDAAVDAARNAAECERVRRGAAACWWECLPQYADRVRSAAAWLIEAASVVGVRVPDVAAVVSAAADAAPSDPGAVDGWESDGGACVGVETPRGPESGPVMVEAPAPGSPFGTQDAQQPAGAAPRWSAAAMARVVPAAECIARAEAEAARLDVIARERNAWAVDTCALFVAVHDGCNVLGVDVADARDWSDHAASVAAAAAKDADRARWEAECWKRDAERSAADMEAMRARTARLFSGEGDVRSRWMSTDGRTVVALAPPAEADIVTESDARFADVLSGAVAAKNAGRSLKSTDVPSKAKHGRGLGTEFKQAVSRASRPLVQFWKAPRIPAEGRPLDGAALANLDADGVCAEVEAAPGVWLPRAAVCLAETASANGWTVAMERYGSGVVIVRAAGVLGAVAGEIVAVWTAGMYDAHRSGAFVAGLRLDGAAELSRVLTTIGQSAEAGKIATAGVPTGASALAPAGVSDPGSVEGWEGDGGAAPGVEAPRPAALPTRLAEDGARDTGAVRRSLRRAEEAEVQAAEARRRAEALQDGASAHYGRFAGGQPILMGHHSARGALRDRARGDAVTRRAMEAAEAAKRAEGLARGARQEADLAETVHGRSRPWVRADFSPGDVVEVRKRKTSAYTCAYQVVRANAKSLTLRNSNTIDDHKALYDQVISRTRDGRTITNPGQDDDPPAQEPTLPQGLDVISDSSAPGAEPGAEPEPGAEAARERAPPRSRPTPRPRERGKEEMLFPKRGRGVGAGSR